MIRFRLPFLFGLAIKLLIAQETMPSEVKAKLEIEALEKRRLSSVDNAEVLQDVLAEDCIAVSPTGVVGKKEHIAQSKHLKATNRSDNLQFNDLRVRLYGSIAIVNGVLAITNTQTRNVRRSAFTDVFVYRDKQWQIINTQRTALP